MTPEERRAYNKAYYAANRETMLEQSKAWRDAHPERTRALNKISWAKYYDAHREEKIAYNTAYNTAHPEVIKESKRRARARKRA